jgi:hypothetical protein
MHSGLTCPCPAIENYTKWQVQAIPELNRLNRLKLSAPLIGELQARANNLDQILKVNAMAHNPKQTTSKVGTLAGVTLSNPNSSGIAKTLAASVVAQTHTGKQTGIKIETIAAKVLTSDKYSADTKTLAASALAQSGK